MFAKIVLVIYACFNIIALISFLYGWVQDEAEERPNALSVAIMGVLILFGAPIVFSYALMHKPLR